MVLDLPAVPATEPADPPAGQSAAGAGLPPGALGSWDPVLDLLAATRAAAGGESDQGATGDAGATGAAGDPRPRDSRLVVFAADHPVAELGLSAWPPGETARRVGDLESGTGPVGRLAAAVDVRVRVVDMGVGTAGGAIDAEVRGRIDVADALSPAAFEEAFAAGRAAADAAVDEGADLLIGAVCGVAVSTPAAALTAAVTGMEPVDATGRGSGIDDMAWIRKAAAVRDALFRVRQAGVDVATMLRVGGGPDLAALTGFVAQAAIRRTVVLVDDLPSALCAVLAHRVAPGADAYVLATCLSAERGHGRLLELLGREPLTRWLLTAGSGAGALLTVPTIRAAWAARAAAGSAVTPRVPFSIESWDPALL